MNYSYDNNIILDDGDVIAEWRLVKLGSKRLAVGEVTLMPGRRPSGE
jgi:hypothetical protein